jgi:hypothetical protein
VAEKTVLFVGPGRAPDSPDVVGSFVVGNHNGAADEICCSFGMRQRGDPRKEAGENQKRDASPPHR